MPTNREQIAQQVDLAIRDGIIQPSERDQAINFMAADDRRADFFGGGFMRTGDYTNKTKEVAEMRRRADAEILAARQAEQSRRDELARWESQARGELEQARRDAAAARELADKVGRYEQILSDFNLGEHITRSNDRPAVPPPALNSPASPPPSPGAPAGAGFISQTEAAQALMDTLRFNGKVQLIAARHYQLFGSPLTDNLIEEAIAANQLGDIEGFWKVKYNVPAREGEIAARQHQEQIDRIRAEERAKIMAEYSNDPGRLAGGPLAGYQEPSAFANAYLNSRAVGYNPLTDGPPDPSKPPPAPEIIAPGQQIAARQEGFNKYWNSHFHNDGTLLPGVKAPANYGEGTGQA